MSKTTDDDELTPLAEAVSDGSAVDWEAEATRRPDLGPLVREFQTLETLAAVFRAPEAREDAVSPPGDIHRPPTAIGQWGRLTLVEKIGEGGFGEVYRAHDSDLDRDVALKLVREDRLTGEDVAARFLAEARRLARVRHPNVVIVHGVDRHDGTIGIWTDLIVGQTLEEQLERQGPFGAQEASLIGIELCRALAAVHLAGLCHGDVKTGNVMREAGGRIVLMDFGAARELWRHGPSAHGTPLTMAPELVKGERATAAADIYSLGVLLYRLTTRALPFEASTIEELKTKLANNERVLLRTRRPDLSASFVRVVDHAMEPDPVRRYATVGAMERALAGAGGQDAQRRWWLLAAVLTVALLAGIAWRAGIIGPGVPAPPAQGEPGTPGNAAGPASQPFAAPIETQAALAPVVALHRRRAGEDVMLSQGDRVVPGDGLYLEFECAEPAFVYVLNEDASGETFALFPAPGLDAANPLAPGARRLPGTRDGLPFDWQVTSAGGSETIVVVAARQRMVHLEQGLSDLAAARPARPVTDAGPSDVERGISGMVPAPEAEVGNRRRVAGLLERAPGEEKPWVWRIRLDNPR